MFTVSACVLLPQHRRRVPMILSAQVNVSTNYFTTLRWTSLPPTRSICLHHSQVASATHWFLVVPVPLVRFIHRRYHFFSRTPSLLSTSYTTIMQNEAGEVVDLYMPRKWCVSLFLAHSLGCFASCMWRDFVAWKGDLVDIFMNVYSNGRNNCCLQTARQQTPSLGLRTMRPCNWTLRW